MKHIVALTLKQDDVHSDVTTLLMVPARARGRAVLIAKDRGIFAGRSTAQQVFDHFKVKVQWRIKDGQRVRPGLVCAVLSGRQRDLLRAERTALNFIQHLSGIATLSRAFVDCARGSKIKVYDTRKTIPGMRCEEKDAVLAGGGCNHRRSLSGAIFIKDNHWKVWHRLPKAQQRKVVKALSNHHLTVIMEAKQWYEAKQAVDWGADVLLLDNLPYPRLKAMIRRVQRHVRAKGRRMPELEISGGVTLALLRRLKRLPVRRVSVGKLTHSAPALDFSIELC